MSRNNEERLGIKDEGQNPPIPAVSNSASPLQFVAPTEFVDLPTQGKFYPEGHPLYQKDTVEIRYMTAKDEDVLTSPNLIRVSLILNSFHLVFSFYSPPLTPELFPEMIYYL